MRVQLDKPLILLLYCHLLQAERSLGFASEENWPELRQYFQGPRLRSLHQTFGSLKGVLDRHGIFPGSKIIYPNASRKKSLLYLFTRWITKWRSSWSFTGEELACMAGAMKSLILLLDRAILDQENTIALRMDLCYCRTLIEGRCRRLAGIERAQELEHFWQAPWKVPVSLQDILGPSHGEEAEPERAAG